MKRLKILLVLFLAFVVLGLMPAQSQATTMYDNRDAWITAVAGLYQDVIIEYLTPGTVFPIGATISIPPAGNTLTFDADLLVAKVPDGGWASWSGGNTPTVLQPIVITPDGPLPVNTLVGTFNSAMSAFGLEIEPYAFDVFDLTLALSDGSSLTQSVNGDGGAAFFGWTGGPNMSFTITSADGAEGFAFGRMVAPVPLPPSVLLLGSGLLGFFGLRRKFKN